MSIGTALGWGDWQTIALAVVLAFLFGYSLTMLLVIPRAMEAGLTNPLFHHESGMMLSFDVLPANAA
jgi:hypothetical protein